MVVAVFVQVMPEAKQQQIREAIAAYEALRQDQASPRGKRETSAMKNLMPGVQSANRTKSGSEIALEKVDKSTWRDDRPA